MEEETNDLFGFQYTVSWHQRAEITQVMSRKLFSQTHQIFSRDAEDILQYDDSFKG